MSTAETHDVIVIGGGPAGAVMAWSLARRGIRVAVVERSHFPREKVCGDFVEPGGLRILAHMGCLDRVERNAPLPITHARIFVQGEAAYRGVIPYYNSDHGLPPHGYIVPRSELDTVLLERAQTVGARIYAGCSASAVERDGRGLQISARGRRQDFVLHAPLVVGADGVQSTVARSVGLARNDARYTAVAQRGYVDGVAVGSGEATIWFDEDLYPGYGWMFPLADGSANVGVGVLSEACRRHGLSVPRMFNEFIAKLRRHHPGCARIELLRPPLGGVVKSYGGVGINHFDGGLLIGDAGSFVDPMTGEGITPGMESALLAAPTVCAALECGRFESAYLARFDRDFHHYFDPAMRYLELWAAITRNRHLRESCLRAGARGWQEAMTDRHFARITGASFGGLALRPSAVISQIAAKIARHMVTGGAGAVIDALRGQRRPGGGLGQDVGAWQRGMRASLNDDLRWHLAWTREVARKSARVLWTAPNLRVRGVTALDYWRTMDQPVPICAGQPAPQ